MKTILLRGCSHRTAFASLLITSLMSAPAAEAASDADGKFFGELRYRYEHVSNNNALSDANAHTLRINTGFQTPEYHGFTGVVEAQVIKHLGAEEFNSLANGQTNFSTVADPDVQQINQLAIHYTDIPDTRVTLGRQLINLDNQRFIGTVDWRQNDQTYDALTVTNQSINGLKAYYSYVANVNRIFAGSTPPDDLTSNMHLVNLSYQVADWMKAVAYGYLMEFENAAALSNQTYGLRLTGETPISEDFTFSYEAEFAAQEDYENNTANYDANYYLVAPKLSAYGFTAGAAYEVLDGDGTNAFQTPLSTLHKFNGWADLFLNTPANGLEDRNVSLAYKFANTNSLLDGMVAKVIYHEFEGEEGGDFGSEVDAIVKKRFTVLEDTSNPFHQINVLLKYADYEAEDAPFVDRDVFWVQAGVTF